MTGVRLIFAQTGYCNALCYAGLLCSFPTCSCSWAKNTCGNSCAASPLANCRTFQLYDRFKTRTHLAKVNTENLRKATPRFWQRLNEHDEEFATDLSQAILIAHMDMITSVLNFLGIPNQEGFFEKDLDAKPHLTEGWQARAFDRFKDRVPRVPAALLHQPSGLGTGRRDQRFSARRVARNAGSYRQRAGAH